MHADWPDNAAVVARGSLGDAERALAEADVVVSERFRHARLAAVFIETRGALAYRDPDTGRLVLWSSTQNPYSIRDAVARIVGVPAEEVRVRRARRGRRLRPQGRAVSGGGAGRPRGAAPGTSGQVGREPARGLRRRAATTASRATRCGSASGKDGVIAGIDASFLADVGAYPAQGTGLTLNTVNHLPGPYRVAHYRNVGTSVVTNKTLNMAYRAAGRPEAVFVMERLMDIGRAPPRPRSRGDPPPEPRAS